MAQHENFYNKYIATLIKCLETDMLTASYNKRTKHVWIWTGTDEDVKEIEKHFVGVDFYISFIACNTKVILANWGHQ